MNRRILSPVLLLAIVLSTLGTGLAGAQTDEEQYVREIRSLIIAADVHLLEAADALAQCLEDFSDCIMDPSLVVRRLNTSRNGLIAIRGSVSSLNVPERYQVINSFVVQGLTDSIEGITLHMEGLREGSLQKFQAGSDLMAVGRAELEEAVDLLRATPPRSPLEGLLLILLGVIAVLLVSSVFLLLRWYRKERQARSLLPKEENP